MKLMGLNVGCWVMGDGCWWCVGLNVGWWVLDVGWWMLNV